MKPKLRFQGFHDDWEEKKLGEVAEIITGGTPKTTIESYWNKKEVPWMSSGEVNNRYIENTEKFISQEGLSNSSAKLIPKNSVLVALAGQGKTRGKVAINQIDLSTNQSIAAIIVNNQKLKYGFLFFNLDNRYLELRRESTGDGGRGGLNKQIISNLNIKFPSLPEQEKIGAFLGQLDDRIEKQEQKIALLKERKKGWMQQLFSQTIRFKDENGQDYPAWEEKKLGEVAEKIQRGASPRPISDKKWFDSKSSIGWIRISDITRSGKYIYSVEQKLSIDGINKSRFLEANNLILSIAATIGKPVINKIPVCIHDGFIVFKNILPSNDIEFLYYYLLYIRPIWFKYQQPGSQFNLNSDLVRNQNIFVPSLPEQEKIAEFLSKQDELIEKEEEKLSLLKEQKKGFLQQMFV